MALAIWRRAVIASFLLMPGVAAAADPPLVQPSLPAALPDWVVTVGAEARLIPAWPGAPTSLYMATGVPLIAIGKPGDPPYFFGARDAFGLPLLDLGQLSVGPVGKLVYPRYTSSYSQLQGMTDVNWAVQGGIYATYWLVPWLRLRAEALQGAGAETGQTGNLFADAVVPFGQLRLSGGPRITVQSASAVAPYFSITPAEAAASGLSPYNAGGGFYSWGAGGQVEYFWNSRWQTHALLEFERISGSAADSPLVTIRGSPNQFTFGLGATYSLNMRPLW